MQGTQTLIAEHDNILRMVDVIRKASLKGLQEGKVDVADFRMMVDFIREYADKTHHGKEENYLFKAMVDSLGEMGTVLVRQGMLVEHDMGRLYVSELSDALDAQENNPAPEHLLNILVAAGSYGNLLKRHIHKENTAVFKYSDANLPEDLAKWVDDKMAAFDNDAANADVREAQLRNLESLEKKYA